MANHSDGPVVSGRLDTDTEKQLTVLIAHRA
jgi:hypothetical protein